MAASIRLRTAQYRKYAALKNWKTQSQAAAAIGVSEPALSRVIRGKRGPGADFIAALLNAFPQLEFADLFEVEVPATDDEPVPA